MSRMDISGFNYDGTLGEADIYDYGISRSKIDATVSDDNWCGFESDDEEVVHVEKKRKPKKDAVVSFLDRPDKLFYGGFLRRKIYKKTDGSKEIQVSSKNEDINCTLCETNHTLSENSNKIFFKDRDSENRKLSDDMLALLQLYDFVVVCSCGFVNYGYIEEVQTVNEESIISHAADVILEETAITNIEVQVEETSNDTNNIITSSEENVPVDLEISTNSDSTISELKNRIAILSERAKSVVVNAVETNTATINVGRNNTVNNSRKKRNMDIPNQISIFDFMVSN